MNKLKYIVTSKTFWTLVLILAVNAIPLVKTQVSSPALDAIDAFLVFLASYFHVTTNPVDLQVAQSKPPVQPQV